MKCRIFRIRWQSGRMFRRMVLTLLDGWWWGVISTKGQVCIQPAQASQANRRGPRFQTAALYPQKDPPTKSEPPTPPGQFLGVSFSMVFQGMKPPVCVGATMLMICMHFHISLLWDFQHVFFQSHFCASLVYSFCSLKCHACHAKSEHRGPEPKGRLKCHACHAKSKHRGPGAQRTPGGPGRTSDPLESLKCHACHAKSKHGSPEPKGRQGRQGVHQTPCKAWSATPPTQNPSTEARSPTSRPLESLKCYACHAKSKHRGPGAQGTPGDNQGRTSCPLESLKCRACHAKCKHRGPEPKGRQGTPGRTSDPLESLKLPRLPRKMQARKPGAQGTPGGRQGVHQTPWRAWSAGPAHERKMQAQRPGAQGTPGDARAYIMSLGEPEVPRLPRKMQARKPGAQGTPGDARAYIRPLGEPEVPAPATQNASTEARSPRDARGRQGVHHAPWRAWSAAPATQNASTEARSQGTPGRTSDPLESLKVPRLPRKSLKCRACHAKCKHRARSPRDARGTPGRTSDPLVSLSAAPATQNASTEARSQGTPGRTSCPLESLKCRACHAKCKHRARSPRDARGRQGVHQTPWRAWSAAPATQSECVRCECVRGKCVRGLVLEVKCVRGKCVRGN